MDTTKSRLKSHDLGAVLSLHHSDLLIAHVFPPSRDLHVVKLIIDQYGGAEYGEYLLAPEIQRFTHCAFRLSADECEALRNSLVGVCELKYHLDRDPENFDPI